MEVPVFLPASQILARLLTVDSDISGLNANTLQGYQASAFSLAAHTHSYQASNANLTALSGLTGAADKVNYFTGAGAMALADFTTVGRNVVAASTQALARTALGLGTIVTAASGDYAALSAINTGYLDITGKYFVNGTPVIYVPNQTNFLNSFFVGNGGASLSHTTGTTGQANVGVGNDALLGITSGANNIGIGTGAGRAITTGLNNTCIGPDAGKTLIGGNNNAFIGLRAGEAVSSASNNVAVGTDAGKNGSTGNSNVWLGYRAGESNGSGGANVYIGSTAGVGNAGAFNVLIGSNAGGGLTSGDNNTMIGTSAGDNNVTGDGNVMIGFFAGRLETGSNLLYIANSNTSKPLIHGDFSAGVLKFHSTVNTDVITDTLSLVKRRSSGTPGSGLGAALRYGLHSTTNEDRDAGRIAARWNDATDASRQADMVFSAFYTTNEREFMRGRGGSAAPMIGFLGATPAVRQTGGAATAGASYGATEQAMLQKIYDMGRTFGFLD